MNSKKTIFATGLVMGTVLSLGLFFSWQTMFAAWSGPAAVPPNGNVAEPVNVSSNPQYKPGAGLGLDRVYSTTTADFLYFDSATGTQLRIDSDNNNLNSNFQINNGDNQTVFSVDESGNINVNNLPLINCADDKILIASSTAPTKVGCIDGLTYGP